MHNNFSIFPDRANRQVNVEIKDNTYDDLMIEIIDDNDQVVYSKELNNNLNKFIEVIDLREQPKGIYFVKIKRGEMIMKVKKAVF